MRRSNVCQGLGCRRNGFQNERLNLPLRRTRLPLTMFYRQNVIAYLPRCQPNSLTRHAVCGPRQRGQGRLLEE